MGSASDLRVGAVIRYNNAPCLILACEHRFMGRGSGFYQVKMRDLKSGRLYEHKFRSNDDVEFVRVEKRPYQYLYNDGDLYYFMSTETYEQVPVQKELIGEQIKYLKENQIVELAFDGEEILAVELPAHVELQVVETEPGVRGDTVTNVLKPAKVETGAVVQVPIFVNEGDVIRVDTRTGEYVERVKG